MHADETVCIISGHALHKTGIENLTFHKHIVYLRMRYVHMCAHAVLHVARAHGHADETVCILYDFAASSAL